MADEIARLVARVEADVNAFRVGIEKANQSLDTMARASARANRGFSDFQRSVVTLNQGFQLLGSGARVIERTFGVVSNFVGNAIRASNEQENALRSLNQTLASTGQFTEAYSRQLVDLSGEFQNVTTFADEAVLSVERQLVAFGAGPDVIKRATGAVLDFAAATGKDLPAAADVVGKAIAGNFTAFSKLGINVDENATKAQKLEQAFGQLESRMGGQARAAAETFAGSISAINTQFDEFLEQIGDAITRSDFLNYAFSFVRGELVGLNQTVEESQAQLGELANSGLKQVTLGALDSAAGILSLAKAFAVLGVGVIDVGKLLFVPSPNNLTDLFTLADTSGIEKAISELAELRARVEGFGTDAPREIGGSTQALDALSAAATGAGAQFEEMSKKGVDSAKKLAEEQQKVADAVTDLSKQLQDEAQGALDAFSDSVSGIEWEAATSGMTETQRRLAELSREYEKARLAAEAFGQDAVAAVEQDLQKGISAIVELGNATEETTEKISNAASQIGDAFADAFEGIALGTRELEDIPDLITDAFAKAFFDTLREKSGFDKLFQGNIFDLVGNIGDIIGGLPDLFSNAFGAILGDKRGFDAAFSSGAFGSGTTGAAVGNLIAGGAGAAGGGVLGNQVGGTPGAIVGAIGGKVLASQLFSVATTGGLTAGTVGALGPQATAALVNSGAFHLGADAAGNIILVPGGGVSTVAVPAVSSTGSSGATAAASSASTNTAATVGGFAALAVAIKLIGDQLQKSKSPQVGGVGAGLSQLIHPQGVTALFDVLGGKSPSAAFSDAGGTKQLLTEIFGGPVVSGILAGIERLGAPSSGQLSRRFLGNEILGGTEAIGSLGPTLNFDPYKSGIVSIEKAAESFPQLFGQAGAAAEAFGATLAVAVKSGQSDAKEFNFVVSTLIDNFGRAGTTGPEAVTRIAAAMAELGITADQAGVAIQDAFARGELTQEQFQASLAGLGQIASVSTQQMVATLQKGLGTEANALFERLVNAGAEAFDAVLAASNDAFAGIAAGLSNELLPNAVAVFALIESLGISSAEAIQKAFEGISAGAAQFPGGTSGPSPQFFVGASSGKLIYGTYQIGQFVPAPAPATTPAEQQQLIATSPKIPGFAMGGIVPGPLGFPTLATVHGGETVIPTGEHMEEFANLIGAAVARNRDRGATRPQIIVVPVIEREDLPQTLYRLQREGRYIPSGSSSVIPPGIRPA